MLVHHRSLPHNLSGFPNNLLVPIYTPGWREALWELSVLPKNTTQCPRLGLEPRPLALESSTPTMRPPCLPYSHTQSFTYSSVPIDIYLWTDTNCKYYQWLSLYGMDIPCLTKFIITVIQRVDINQRIWLQKQCFGVTLFYITKVLYFANFVEKNLLHFN